MERVKSRPWRHLAINVGWYFLTVPPCFALGIALTESHPGPVLLWPLYLSFTIPVWPGVLLAVPLLSLWSITMPSSSQVPPRVVVILGATFIVGALPVALFGARGLFFALGGALFGWRFRYDP
jgi:hypothetical protein